MFFLHPNDLTNLDIANGQCYNQSIPQNLTFGYQGLPFSDTSAVNGSANHTSAASTFMTKESSGTPSLMALVAAIAAVSFIFL